MNREFESRRDPSIGRDQERKGSIPTPRDLFGSSIRKGEIYKGPQRNNVNFSSKSEIPKIDLSKVRTDKYVPMPERLQSIIEAVPMEGPSDINTIFHVLHIAVERAYTRKVPLLYEGNLPLPVRRRLQDGTMTPEDLPTALFFSNLGERSATIDYSKILTNFRVSVGESRIKNISQIKPNSLSALYMEADIVGMDGKVKKTVKKGYNIYLPVLGKRPTRNDRALYGRFYAPQVLLSHTNPLLRFSSYSINRQSWLPTLKDIIEQRSHEEIMADDRHGIKWNRRPRN